MTAIRQGHGNRRAFLRFFAKMPDTAPPFGGKKSATALGFDSLAAKHQGRSLQIRENSRLVLVNASAAPRFQPGRQALMSAWPAMNYFFDFNSSAPISRLTLAASPGHRVPISDKMPEKPLIFQILAKLT